jgi:hypothetical protein
MAATTRPAIFNLRSPISCAYPRVQEIEAQNRHRPAVMVLLVNRPLRAEVVNQDQPVAGKRQEIIDGRGKIAAGATRLTLSSAISSVRRRRTG